MDTVRVKTDKITGGDTFYDDDGQMVGWSSGTAVLANVPTASAFKQLKKDHNALVKRVEELEALKCYYE